MTLKEADRAARKGLPIVHSEPGQPDIEYCRITQAGYKYGEKGRRSSFVQLLDKSGHSVTDANPAYCSIMSGGEAAE